MSRPRGPTSEGEERFRNLAEQAHDLISETDAEGRFLYVSPNHEHTLGFSPDALIGTLALDLVHPEDLPEASHAFAEGVDRKQSGRAVVRLATRDGDWRWFEISGRPYATSGGDLRVALIGRDTSERRAAEQALRDSERRYRLLVETASSGIVESDREGVITFANRAYAEMMGAPAHKLIGRRVWEFTAEPDDRERVRGEISLAVRDEPRPRRRIENLRGPAGRRVAAEIDWNFVRDAEGRVTGFVSFVNDVTRREEADRALADSHRFISHIAEATPHMLCVFEIATRRLLYCNSRVHQVLGWDPADLDAFGTGLFEKVVHPEDLARVAQGMIEATRSDDDRAVVLEYRTLHGSGDWLWLRARLAVFARNPDGSPRELLMASEDITAQHRAVEALRDSEERFRLVAENAYDYILELGPDAGVRYLSPSFRDILGFDPDKHTTRDSYRLLHPDDRDVVVAAMRSLLDGRALSPIVYRHRHANGEYRWLETYGTPRPTPDGRFVAISITRDITDQVAAEQEARLLHDQLLQAQKLESLGVLAGGVAHDFNNLLVGILGNASLALADAAPDSPLHDTLKGIETAALRAAELTNQMLAYSGKGRFVVEPLDLSPLVDEMAHLLESAISKKAVLCRELAPDLPSVEADATQLRQLVMNLITNASDALGDQPGKITLRTRLVPESERAALGARLADAPGAGPCVMIEVEDTGAGMDGATCERIFEPFFTTKFTGRGLGLAAALGIVRGHRGAIDVVSEPGRGTCFRILLPVTTLRARATRPRAASPASAAGSGVVLVADDEAVVRRMASRILGDAGFDVLEAPDGRVAVDRFAARADEVTAVLLDLTLPRLGGEEALREIRAIRSDVPVILTSGYSESEIAVRFEGVQLEGFLQKPFRPADLLERIQLALALADQDGAAGLPIQRGTRRT